MKKAGHLARVGPVEVRSSKRQSQRKTLSLGKCLWTASHAAQTIRAVVLRFQGKQITDSLFFEFTKTTVSAD